MGMYYFEVGEVCCRSIRLVANYNWKILYIRDIRILVKILKQNYL
jgi:hypothetical protein